MGREAARDWGAKVTVGYTFFGMTLVGLTWERLSYHNDDNTAGNVNDYERDAWAVTLRHQIGPGTIRAAYAKSEDADCSRVGGGSCNVGVVEEQRTCESRLGVG